MAGIEDFVASPCEELLDSCTKDQLLKVAEKYDIDLSGLSDKRKGNVKALVKMQLIGKGVLVVKQGESGEPQAAQSFSIPSGNFTFEQQKELLLLQLAHERDKQQWEVERQKIEMEKLRMEFEKQVAIERLRCETEQAKIDLQATRLGLVREGKLSGEVWQGEDGSSPPSNSPDIVSSLCLLPKFNERDPDVFFSLFERLAEARSWSDSDRTLLLQCVLTGKAQEAYASLGSDLTYESVKAAVLKAYELVPEAYRQRFRTWEKRASHIWSL